MGGSKLFVSNHLAQGCLPEADFTTEAIAEDLHESAHSEGPSIAMLDDITPSAIDEGKNNILRYTSDIVFDIMQKKGSVLAEKVHFWICMTTGYVKGYHARFFLSEAKLFIGRSRTTVRNRKKLGFAAIALFVGMSIHISHKKGVDMTKPSISSSNKPLLAVNIDVRTWAVIPFPMKIMFSKKKVLTLSLWFRQVCRVCHIQSRSSMVELNL